MSIGHKHRHTGRRPRRSYRSRFRAERHRETDAVDECGIVRSANTVMGDFLADAEGLLAARLERVSLDDPARQAQPNPLHPQHGAHHG